MPKGNAKEGYLNTNAHLEMRVALLMAQLAESQAREQRLREALRLCSGVLEEDGRDATAWLAQTAMEAASDDSALREMIEAEREACAKACEAKIDAARQEAVSENARRARDAGDDDAELVRLRHCSDVGLWNSAHAQMAATIRARNGVPLIRGEIGTIER